MRALLLAALLLHPVAARAEGDGAPRRGPVLVLVSEARGAAGWWNGAAAPTPAERALADALTVEQIDVVDPPAGAGGTSESEAWALGVARRLGARFVVVGQAEARDAGHVRPTEARAASGRYAVRVLAVAGGRPVGVANGTRYGFGADVAAARSDALREAAAAVASDIAARLPSAPVRPPPRVEGLALHLRGATTFVAVEAVEALCQRWDPGTVMARSSPGEVAFVLPAARDVAGLVEAARVLPVAGHLVAAAQEDGVVVVRLEPVPEEPPVLEGAPAADPEDLPAEVP